MNILHFPPLRALMPPKILWVRANRILAWALIVAPCTQWALGSAFVSWLPLYLAIFLGHAALSLALFGLPKATNRRATTAMLLLGRRPLGHDARNRFLLGGYRVGLTSLILLPMAQCLPVGLTFAVMHLIVGLPIIGLVIVAVLVIVFWPLFRTPLTLVQHLYPAIVHALQRWGVRDGASILAALIVAHFFVLSAVNLLK
ncbi:hypothetical protein [Massilia sp. CCM 8734]|uniref:hypothetical protein n=1 Tax=Massilia sp. CCM 8734 TaxID=2609283 RepID=UPI0014245CB3|nr:hypothetical protein [Massilia sp. CCM 8734]NHZ98559.1 hypothetical protein [Massilia sp. CCM 8734]